MLAYNLSPSFNWDAAGMDDSQVRGRLRLRVRNRVRMRVRVS